MNEEAKSEPAKLDRIFRRDQLPEYTGLERSAIDDMIDGDEFPKPVRLNNAGRILGWLESELVAWQKRRKALRDSGTAPLPKYRPVPPRPELLKKNGGPRRGK